jgi:hypothetical protein
MMIELMAADRILRIWREDPKTPRSAYRGIYWLEHHARPDERLDSAEILANTHLLWRYAPSAFSRLFCGVDAPPHLS